MKSFAAYLAFLLFLAFFVVVHTPLVAYGLWLMWTEWLERVEAGGCGGRWVWTQPDTCSIVGTALASATVLFGFALKELGDCLWLVWLDVWIRLERRMQASVQLKMLETWPADIPECPVCLEPMLPPVKIYSWERGEDILYARGASRGWL